MIITIDGPTASGKSSAARALAHQLHIYYLNTGLLYRALAYLLLTYNKSLTSPQQEDILPFIDSHRLKYIYDQDAHEHIFFDDQELTYLLKTPVIDKAASVLSLNAMVRTLLLDVQRNLALQHSCVVEGRDTGTVVFPHADYKFYLTAPVSVRAVRWMNDQLMRGIQLDINQATAMIIERDKRDSERAIAPLIIPKNAVIIDSGNMDMDAVVQALYNLVNKK